MSVPLPRLSCFVTIERGDADERAFGLLLVGPDGVELAAAALRVYEWNDLGEYTSSGAWMDLRFRAPGVHVLRVVCGTACWRSANSWSARMLGLERNGM